jgi:biotin synthase
VTGNPEEDGDQLLMAKLDLEPETEENRKPLERN